MKTGTLLLAAAALACACAPACAGPADAYRQIGLFEDTIVQQVTAVAGSGELAAVARQLFLALATALFVLKCSSWALRGFQLADLVDTVAQIIFTALLMFSFNTLMPAAFNAALYIGQVMMTGIAGVDGGGGGQAVSTPVALVDLLVRYGTGITPHCSVSLINPLACLQGAVVSIVASLIIAVVVALLCVCIMVIDIWGFWLYAVGLALGPVLLPFALYKRLAFLPEGLLRFTAGSLVYVIVARINLSIVAVAILSQTQMVALRANGSATLEVTDLVDIASMLVFGVVGIFSLMSTGKFAKAIVAGAGGGGVNVGRLAVRIIAIPVQALATGVVGAAQGVTARRGNASSGNARGSRSGSRDTSRTGGSRSGQGNRAQPRPAAGTAAGDTATRGIAAAAALGAARAYRDAALRRLKRTGFARAFERGHRQGRAVKDVAQALGVGDPGGRNRSG